MKEPKYRPWWQRVMSKLIVELNWTEPLKVQALRYRQKLIRLSLPIIHEQLDPRLIRVVAIMEETPRLDGDEIDPLQTKAGRSDLLAKCWRIPNPFTQRRRESPQATERQREQTAYQDQ